MVRQRVAGWLARIPHRMENLAKIQTVIHNAAARVGDSMTFMNSKLHSIFRFANFLEIYLFMI